MSIVKTVPVLYEMYEYTIWEKCRDLNVKRCGTSGCDRYIMIMACMTYGAAIPGGLCTH